MMSKKIVKILILCMPVLLTGCATVSNLLPIQFGQTDTTKIDRWISDKQFGRAIRALEKIVKEEPTRRNRIKLAETRNLAAQYEKAVIQKTRQKIRRGKWQGAFVYLDDAISHYPESRRLSQFRTSLSRRQSKKIQQTRLKLVAMQATNKLRMLPIYRELNRLDPQDSDIAWQLKKTRLEIIEMGKSLTASGREAIRQNNFELAQRYLELADQLNPTQENTRALADLAQKRIIQIQKKLAEAIKRRKEKNRKPLSVAQKSRRMKLRRLTVALRAALKSSDYDKANKLLTQAYAISLDHPEIEKLRMALDNSIHAKVNQLVHSGNEYYSKGRIEQARSSWKKALKLDPKNTHILSSVERANRVLAKLREINGKKAKKAKN